MFKDQTTIVREFRMAAQKVQNKSMSEKVFAQVLSEVSGFAETTNDLADLQNFIVEIIPRRLPYYNWTGFYMLDPDDSQTLVLGPFRGAPTEHVRIPVNQGICGAAVAQNSTVIVDDVHSDPRYLACSLEARSEIVVPIRANGAVAGEIDIDSHDLAAFSPQDREFLEKCAIIVGGFMERTQTVSSGAK
jgi:L-methionine (R)-S-oxide reductase